MDKGKTGETVMTVLSELLADSLTEVSPGLPLGILEARVKRRLEYLKDGRSRSTKKALETLSRENLISISRNGYGENVYSLNFDSYRGLWRLLLFIYDNAPPFSMEGNTVRVISPKEDDMAYLLKEDGTYWFDIVVSLINNGLLTDTVVQGLRGKGEDPMRYELFYLTTRDRRNKHELVERAFINLIVGNLLTKGKGPDYELLTKWRGQGISDWKPDKYWNIRFEIWIAINKWLGLIQGRETPYSLFTYFARKSYNFANWDKENWPSDKEVEENIASTLNLMSKAIDL